MSSMEKEPFTGHRLLASTRLVDDISHNGEIEDLNPIERQSRDKSYFKCAQWYWFLTDTDG
jgi:hypothetical protein